jgi:hypothetical protein
MKAAYPSKASIFPRKLEQDGWLNLVTAATWLRSAPQKTSA